MTGTEQVNAYMDKLDHPLKQEIEAVREIILNSNEKLSERVKWNAPSFYYKEDLVTFHVRNQKAVHLVFHHVNIVRISSEILEGDYKDRRMMYFKDGDEVLKWKSELERIMKALVAFLD